MASIKAIESRSVHQIQSGQVIVDLCSVVKELVENSLDAKASSIEVRFKNNGLESIEVQDNGLGIGPEDFESIALKHYTSKLSSYDDLTKLNTFGFRGEALSSMCALSDFHVITARQCDKPKGTRLDFETSGRLKSQTVVASTQGTSVSVEHLFKNLPVRRKELERNIKREYQKVLVLLNAYACISTGVRFNVSNLVSKGKKTVVFSTQGHVTTKENIANVFSSKAVASLVTLDLSFDLQSNAIPAHLLDDRESADISESRKVQLVGHISRPVVGEGRQTPDRQMFFVNSRPCHLPQVAKAINEVYRSYNVTQSPFIFANLIMDTNAYDVNVSPDKRTILLHDQPALLEALKTSLTDLFEEHEQSVPQVHVTGTKIPAYKPLTINKAAGSLPISAAQRSTNMVSSSDPLESDETASDASPPRSIVRKFAERATVERANLRKDEPVASMIDTETILPKTNADTTTRSPPLVTMSQFPQNDQPLPRLVQEFNKGMGVQINPNAAQRAVGNRAVDAEAMIEELPQESIVDKTPQAQGTNPKFTDLEEAIPAICTISQQSVPGSLQNALDRTRRRRLSEETATITIGNITTTAKIGSPATKQRRVDQASTLARRHQTSTANPILLKSLRAFAAPGSQMNDREMDDFDLRAAAKSSNATGSDSDSSVDDSDSFHEDSLSGSDADAPVASEHREDSSDDEYIDEDEKKRREEARVAKLIADAEATAARPSEDNMKRAIAVLRGRTRKDATIRLVQTVCTEADDIRILLNDLAGRLDRQQSTEEERSSHASDNISAEERLALTVSKTDFARMSIIGQFNLGFILAVRPSNPTKSSSLPSSVGRNTDELFIIDQHASDEKFNFERLQAITVVQNQPLVRPKELDLTAVDEEIVLNHREALLKNGFNVEADMSGDLPVGRRCRLISLPMSKEVTFGTRDLEELLALLTDHAISDVPRPSKVRRMFAMRACRSSIMVGRTLTRRQMETVVRHMGEIDKPWNCPHGRPTMRHLFGLGSWQSWKEGDGLTGMEDTVSLAQPWTQFVENFEEAEESAEDDMDDD